MLEGFAAAKPQGAGGLPGLAPLSASSAPAPPGAGMFNAFGFSLFGGPTDGAGGALPGLGAFAASAAAPAAAVDGLPGGGHDQLMPVAASLKLPAAASGAAGNASALSAAVAGLSLGLAGDLPSQPNQGAPQRATA
jgi:hypothetical protein